MKKWMSIMLIAMMMIMAAAASAETFTAKGAFTIDLPYGWEADTSENDENSSPSEKYYYLGYLVSDDAVIEMDISYDSGYAGESLSKMSKDEIEDYKAALKEWLEDGSDVKAQFVGIYYVGDYQVPFVIFKESSARYGDDYYAECLSGGWCIAFEYYMYYEDDALTTAGLNDLLDVLSTFTPVQ